VGTKVALQFIFGNRGGHVFSIDMPDLKHPLWMRGRTSDVPTFFQVIIGGEYDISDTAQGKRLIKEYDRIVALGARPLIIDCGANIGLSCISFAKQFPKAHIIGIEPDIGSCLIATKNTAGYSNIELMRGGVWDEPGKLRIINPSDEPWAIRVERETAPTDCGIPAFTIDEISGGKSIFIVKIDVEGAEQFIFRSNIEWIGKTTMIAIELHDWLFPSAGTSRNFLQAIVKQKCDIVLKGENLFFLMSDRLLQEI
jgi:FkbM family methyltransferase